MSHRFKIDPCYGPSQWLSEAPRRRSRVAAARAARAARLFTPLLPDDYLELINPLWSTQELRGRIERIEPRDRATRRRSSSSRAGSGRATSPASTCASASCVDGVHHWRAYSLTSDPGRPDGCISITPKLVEAGKVSPYLVRKAQPGAIVRLGGVEGTFVLPDPLPEQFLFISAGSGITPIMSMLRALARRDALDDVVLLHSARTPDDVIFGAELRELAGATRGFRLHEQLTGEMGRMGPQRPRRAVPGLARARGVHQRPGRACSTRWTSTGSARATATACTWSASSPSSARRTPSTARAARSASPTATSRPRATARTPILVAGEEAGATLPYGCRMGICHTCVGQALLRPGPRPAHRQGLGLERRDGPHLRQRPRGPRRDRPVTRPNQARTPWPR